ncbi:DMT family transporter [Acinetobacter sp. WZC-1]|uniref:DMT family transporter n=1 Tax=Acinetobacter sp. WZC-1 TaxID=3459034 RepID=UPI00403DDD20
MNERNTGWLNGLAGVIIFAGSMPATRIAVQELSPEFLTAARAVIAGIIGLFCLILSQQPRPSYQQLKSLLLVISGVVIGFPLLTALALQTISSARGLVFVGLLPLATAIFGVLRARERPGILFWFFSVMGSCFVASFMILNHHEQHFQMGDLYMLAAVLICGLGYAEGGRLSREMGGWQVIFRALVVAMPLMLICMLYYFPPSTSQISLSTVLGLLYVSLFSTLIGFFFWYKGLALGGIAQVGQIQLLQPFIGLTLSAVLLREYVSLSMIMVCAAVVVCVAMAKKFA